MLKQRSFRETAKRYIDQSIHIAFSIAARHEGVRAAYERLLCHVYRQTDLLRPRGKCGDRPGNGRCALNAGLLALALHHTGWLRPVETWTPKAVSALPQFTFLAQHLFALYPIPAFMTSAWFELPPGERVPHHEWFKHLGLGHNIRQLKLPLVFTRTMAHWFNQAKDHYTVDKALRWAQVRGLGGHEKLAETVASSRLGKVFEHEDFWTTVLNFFVKHPKMDLAHICPIVDFLQHQRFQPQEVFVRGVQVKQAPPQPEFSLKGRTLRSLLRQVNEWHEQLGKDTKIPTLLWTRCKIGEYEFIEGKNQEDRRRWTITEFLTSGELQEEGRKMRHCVASYSEQCSNRRISIWSMKVENDQGRKPVLTMEVDLPTRTICQVRGRCNRLPKDHEKEILRRWAMKEKLRMAVNL